MTYDGNIKNKDLLALREYVTHDSGSLNKADSTVQLMVTHSNLKARFMEIRFDRYVSWDPRYFPWTRSFQDRPEPSSREICAGALELTRPPVPSPPRR